MPISSSKGKLNACFIKEGKTEYIPISFNFFERLATPWSRSPFFVPLIVQSAQRTRTGDLRRSARIVLGAPWRVTYENTRGNEVHTMLTMIAWGYNFHNLLQKPKSEAAIWALGVKSSPPTSNPTLNSWYTASSDFEPNESRTCWSTDMRNGWLTWIKCRAESILETMLESAGEWDQDIRKVAFIQLFRITF
jgi:hypothetical protein